MTASIHDYQFYNVRPATACGSHELTHQYHTFECLIHCECKDHYYRCHDCKHIRAWLLAYDDGLVHA